MYLNIILFISTLYVVNASAVMIKANDDTVAAKADNTLGHSRYMMPPRCTDKICGQFCDLVGFDGGACLDGRCKCNPKQGTADAGNTDNVDTDLVMKREAKDILVEDAESFSPPEYSILDNIYDKCNEICDRVCSFLHFEGGTCSSGRCKCSKKESSTNDEDATDHLDDTNLITEQENKK
ncbi:unnamed protein product [Arctia plantaginis]|uniref:Uncharacterized protein n=1 Tax=Arctia plantaginis TaxID=874455 RepID=A0A8S1B2P4_ARCPL|nr:unnamed protein product [Arctia plantaginis]CAB3256769.1 unnamed protein product [Arctia plantaginis]